MSSIEEGLEALHQTTLALPTLSLPNFCWFLFEVSKFNAQIIDEQTNAEFTMKKYRWKTLLFVWLCQITLEWTAYGVHSIFVCAQTEDSLWTLRWKIDVSVTTECLLWIAAPGQSGAILILSVVACTVYPAGMGLSVGSHSLGTQSNMNRAFSIFVKLCRCTLLYSVVDRRGFLCTSEGLGIQGESHCHWRRYIVDRWEYWLRNLSFNICTYWPIYGF